MKRGVFWVIDNNLIAFPFADMYPGGVAKSGNTYNHRKLWPEVKPKGCNHPYSYYPRGRVEITGRGKSIVYMNPTINDSFISAIKTVFCLDDNTIIKYDHSEHYKCHKECLAHSRNVEKVNMV